MNQYYFENSLKCESTQAYSPYHEPTAVIYRCGFCDVEHEECRYHEFCDNCRCKVSGCENLAGEDGYCWECEKLIREEHYGNR